MSWHHRILPGIYFPLKLARAIGRPLGLSSPNRLRVLLYHDIPPPEQFQFARQIRWLAQSWSFVTPEYFVAMISGAEPIQGSNLLLTFDDGFVSNRQVAEQVLKPLGIQALFFVVSDFVNIEDPIETQCFIAKHIFPGLHVESIPAHLRNMNWDDLAYLLETGHTIGAHTCTHIRLSELHQNMELEAEIIGSAAKLESKLGIKVDHFAYSFGNLTSFSQAALAVARQRFRFIYTGMRGDNSSFVPSWSLRRDAISPIWSLWLLGALLEGGTDLRYVRDLAQFESWGLSNL